MQCKMIRYILAAIYALGILLLWPPALTAAKALMPLTFVPQWLPQAQFAGYYAADDKGFYKKRGIELVILRGGPGFPAAELLSSNKTTFATLFLSEALQLRGRNVKLVNIGQIVQRSGFMLIAKKGSGITKPEDLNHKKVSLWENFRVQPQVFFRKYGIAADTVIQGTTVNLFLRGGVDAASAMWYNEYHTILNAGWNENELTLFFFDKYGLNFPEDGIYVQEETFKRAPGLCCDFVRASLEGWKYVFANQDEAIDIVMKYAAEARAETNRTHQEWMLARMKDLIQPEDSNQPMGLLDSRDYQNVANELFKSGLISRIVPFDQFYINCLGERNDE